MRIITILAFGLLLTSGCATHTERTLFELRPGSVYPGTIGTQNRTFTGMIRWIPSDGQFQVQGSQFTAQVDSKDVTFIRFVVESPEVLAKNKKSQSVGR